MFFKIVIYKIKRNVKYYFNRLFILLRIVFYFKVLREMMRINKKFEYLDGDIVCFVGFKEESWGNFVLVFLYVNFK